MLKLNHLSATYSCLSLSYQEIFFLMHFRVNYDKLMTSFLVWWSLDINIPKYSRGSCILYFKESLAISPGERMAPFRNEGFSTFREPRQESAECPSRFLGMIVSGADSTAIPWFQTHGNLTVPDKNAVPQWGLWFNECSASWRTVLHLIGYCLWPTASVAPSASCLTL